MGCMAIRLPFHQTQGEMQGHEASMRLPDAHLLYPTHHWVSKEDAVRRKSIIDTMTRL